MFHLFEIHHPYFQCWVVAQDENQLLSFVPSAKEVEKENILITHQYDFMQIQDRLSGIQLERFAGEYLQQFYYPHVAGGQVQELVEDEILVNAPDNDRLKKLSHYPRIENFPFHETRLCEGDGCVAPMNEFSSYVEVIKTRHIIDQNGVMQEKQIGMILCEECQKKARHSRKHRIALYDQAENHKKKLTI